MNTQYGFRKGKRTTHALYIARRIQDLAEQSGDNIVLVLLDWEKAFDKIDQARMFEALRRLNIPRKVIVNNQALSANPKFKVKDRDGESEHKTQDSGIRQGCPLTTISFPPCHDRYV